MARQTAPRFETPRTGSFYAHSRRLAPLILAGLLLSACERKAPEEVAVPETPDLFVLETVDFPELPGWAADEVAAALPALQRSCRRLLSGPDSRPVGPQGVGGSVADWRAPCAAVAAAAPGDSEALRTVLEAEFQPFRVINGSEETGLFTGYYEAELKGALFPGGEYQTPLYKRPSDLVSVNLGTFDDALSGHRIEGRVDRGRLVPYYTRAEIDSGAIAAANLELLWASDPVDVFFLHVQGSGKVTLPDGSAMRVGFAGSNGQPFVALGRLLIDEGHISREAASMQSIRDWLRANPEKAEALMQRNPRYIFFRTINGDGPIGAQGVALTPRRSLAVDPAFMPLGAPVYLDTTWPGSDKPLRRLMVAQDSGKAIKGPIRGDFYWGSGEAALAEAGRMKQKGRYYLLLPRAVAERRNTAS